MLRPARELADGSYLAKIYPCQSLRNRDEGGIVVRVIRYSLSDPRRAGYGREHVLLTTLPDERTHPARELIILYHERWEIEVAYCESEQLLGRHDPMVWRARSVARAHPMAWFVGSRVVLRYAGAGRHEEAARRPRPWYKLKVGPTLGDMLA